MYHGLFIHLSEGHLSCLQILAITNKAVLNIHVQVFVLIFVPRHHSHFTVEEIGSKR